MENPNYREQIRQAYADMDRAPADPWRPAFHLTPPSGTLGDPNGLCQVGDTYHIFDVTSPLSCRVTGRTPCVWGHFTTRDFIHYTLQPIAIYPDNRRDRDGVYSGSALVDKDRLYLYYTGNVRHHGDYDYIHAGREQNVLRVESEDGVHFTGKTLLMTNEDFPADMTNHVRDPQILTRDGRIYLLLGARTLEDVGCALVYESGDGTRFHLVNRLTTPEKFGYMWECPDLAVVDGQPLFICCPQGIPHEEYRYQNAHQCGCFPVKGDFAADAELGDFRQFDYGFDLYAARTLKADDGRVLLFAWMGMSETSYNRNICADRGWDQVIAMPRELHWKDGHLWQTPIAELAALRQDHTRSSAAGGCRWQSRRCELVLSPQAGQDVTLHLYEDATLRYRAAEGVVTLEMGPVCGGTRGVRRMKLDALTKMDIYLDGSTLEVFFNDGYAAMTSRIFGDSTEISADAFAGQADFYNLHGFSIVDAREDGV